MLFDLDWLPNLPDIRYKIVILRYLQFLEHKANKADHYLGYKCLPDIPHRQFDRHWLVYQSDKMHIQWLQVQYLQFLKGT